MENEIYLQIKKEVVILNLFRFLMIFFYLRKLLNLIMFLCLGIMEMQKKEIFCQESGGSVIGCFFFLVEIWGLVDIVGMILLFGLINF